MEENLKVILMPQGAIMKSSHNIMQLSKSDFSGKAQEKPKGPN